MIHCFLHRILCFMFSNGALIPGKKVMSDLSQWKMNKRPRLCKIKKREFLLLFLGLFILCSFVS